MTSTPSRDKEDIPIGIGMQRHYEEQSPPDYFDVVNSVQTATEPAETTINRDANLHDREPPQSENNLDRTPAGPITQLHDSLQSTIAYLKNPSSFEGIHNASNSYKGFLHIMYKQEKLPVGFVKNIIYKSLLFIYYLINFIYSIIAVSVQGEHYAYYLIYMFISLTGLLFEVIVIVVDVRERNRLNSSVQSTNHPREVWTTNSRRQHHNYSHKAKTVFVNFVLVSLGEFLIYPITVCNLYGFINERAWRFNNGLAGCNFFIFLYSALMDVIFAKFFTIQLIRRIIRIMYTEYDKLFQPRRPFSWKRYSTPVYLTIPFAITTALTHYFMLGIIGVRIYVDNFNTERDDTDEITPNTGNYEVTAFTGYMIGFAICLQIFTTTSYLLLNKLWFYEVYSVIYRSTTINRSESMPPKLSWNMKLFAFVRDPLAFLTVIILMVLFIMFTVGTYLPDYDSSVASSARDAVQSLGAWFIILFLLSNLQAAIIFVIVVVIIVTMLLCVLCIVCACLCSSNSEQSTSNP